ncbi:MAG: CHAD domain-containing protein [Saprospiraceae bacterium]|nr:CHAD domain-containing protein [Saprospiraceae bacterium]
MIESLEEPEDIHSSIHQARKNMKMMRAVLRLIRFQLPGKIYNRENKFYRDVARRLSLARDLTAMTETIDKLTSTKRKQSTENSLIQIKDEILSSRKNYTQEHQKLILNSASLLKDHSPINEELEWDEDYFRNLLKGLGKIYRQAYKYQQKCSQHNTDERMHEYRKKVKYLRYHLTILKNMWPKMVVAWENELNRLTDFLGDANDIVVLSSHQKKIHKNSMDSQTKAVLERRKSRCHREALALGAKLFAEKPGPFKKRIEVYLQEWEAIGNV